MFCPECGAKNADDARFCESCGTPLEPTPVGGSDNAAPPPTEAIAPQAQGGPACPQCGAGNEPDAGFCESCGAPLGGAMPDVQAAPPPVVPPAPEPLPLRSPEPAPVDFVPSVQPSPPAPSRRGPLVLILLLGAAVIALGFFGVRSWQSGNGVFGLFAAGGESGDPNATTGTLTAQAPAATPVPTKSATPVPTKSATPTPAPVPTAQSTKVAEPFPDTTISGKDAASGSSSPAAPAATPRSKGVTYQLGNKSASAPLGSSYPRSDLLISLTFNYSKPGTILDTVGINKADTGSFSLMVDGNGIVQFQVFDPQAKSAGAVGNGWHVLRSRSKLRAGEDHTVEVYVGSNHCTLSVLGTKQAELPLSTRLSGNPLFVGDFPGDEAWSKQGHETRMSMTGTVTLEYLGNPVR